MTRRPEHLLILLGVAATLGFSVWQALLNNYAIEVAAFTGREIGILQSLREVPGFLAFTTVFVLLIIREQAFALVAVALLGLGVALTGFLPTEYGLYFTTVLMSTGFHYFYTVQQSLTLQWIEKERAPEVMGRLSAASSVAALLAFGTVWLGMSRFGFDYRLLYLLAGTAVVVLALFAAIAFPRFPQAVPQRKHLLMRRRYWLFYALTFMSGARRQIFIVFAGFLMVEKFGFSAANIALLFLINHVINTWAAPRIGRLIGRFGERPMLTLEYSGLILIFTAYAFVENASVAVLLYLLDHVLFAMAIAIRTYFQKIADPADMAATAGVSFTINHVAAVIIPVLFGLLWLHSPAAVFLSGTAMAAVSLTLSRRVPSSPCEGNEVRSFQPKAPAH
ncbi:MAG: MFS transporter [Xanthomonadales bacterium]|nr:MFS transporter [Gammaproteobacteria bacterium]MBT8049932.1 MFS transporter [Gammaproteobacteria bacterium]NNJ78943.1 MFS transporter [Xanthomonadales bacterium]NNL05034.1 MFS transporter [Xanthomonadales bacterium]